MSKLTNFFESNVDFEKYPIARCLIPIVVAPTEVSRRGYPFFQEETYRLLRDRVPHILGMGLKVYDCLGYLERLLDKSNEELSEEALIHNKRAVEVVKMVVRTASITAPPDLWLLRHVLANLEKHGILEACLGDGVRLQSLRTLNLLTEELECDLAFLVSRGYLLTDGTTYRVSNLSNARLVMTGSWALEWDLSKRASSLWANAFANPGSFSDWDLLGQFVKPFSTRDSVVQDSWVALPEEIELGYRLVPLILGLHAAEVSAKIIAAGKVLPGFLRGFPEHIEEGIGRLLQAAGLLWAPSNTQELKLSPLGKRVLERGVGPFGIIEAYYPYMVELSSIWLGAKKRVTVNRATNIAASQLANARSFVKVNDAIDRFCLDTGHQIDVFIEHALGRGEATRQRFERIKVMGRVGKAEFVGADLEDAAVDAAILEQAKGLLPEGMKFVRGADIGKPEILLNEMKRLGVPTDGAVMVVGNGFHEVRNQTDDAMIEVFRGYYQAGLLVVFTEESALLDDDLLETAWNTYHAGFRYVHERSGQVLRPAHKAPEPRIGKPLRTSWTDCAQSAGYVRLQLYCSRSRTIFPYRPKSGRNPAISVNHFLVPDYWVEKLRISTDSVGEFQ